MATTTKKSANKSQEDAAPVIERSEPMTLGPSEGGNNVLAAWRGLYHLFGAKVSRFDVTADGIVAVDLTFQPRVPVSAETLVADLTRHGDKPVSRRLDLVELYPFIVDANDVPEFTNPADLTSWMVSHLKGAGDGDGSRSPQYAKDSITDYKGEHNIAAPRGRRRRIVRLDNLAEVKTETLADVAIEELERLEETIKRAISERAASNANAEMVSA